MTAEPDPDAIEFGRLLREHREYLGLTLRATAAQSGVPFTTIQRIEAGHPPTFRNYNALTRWLCENQIDDRGEKPVQGWPREPKP